MFSKLRNLANFTIYTDGAELLRFLEIDPDVVRSLDHVAAFPLQVPFPFVLRMQKRNPRDPLLLQLLPQLQELSSSPGYGVDPLYEKSYSPLPGLLHKYHGRVLLLLTSSCPINCRFCFRRYERAAVEDWAQVLTYLAQDATIHEVILSGGEPLLWEDDDLNWLIQKLAAIAHIKRLRIHTRLPLVIPAAITAGLIALLQQAPLPVAVVIHCNHAHEIDAHVAQVLAKLRACSNVTLLNQTVLLRGINDNSATLVALSEKLYAVGVLPYYLHLLDQVAGATHFAVTENVAQDLLAQITHLLPGYLVPKMVRDESEIGGSSTNRAKRMLLPKELL